MTHLSLTALTKFYKGLAPYVSQWRNPQHKENSCEFQQIIRGLSPKFSWSLWDPSFLPFSHFLYSASFASLFLLFTLVHMFQNAVPTTLFFTYLRLLFFYSYLSHFLAIKLICFFTFFLIFHYYWFFPFVYLVLFLLFYFSLYFRSLCYSFHLQFMIWYIYIYIYIYMIWYDTIQYDMI
jgi:hypothetical protein